MPTNQASIPYMQIINVPAFVYSKAKRLNNCSGVILPSGEAYYTINGKQVSNEEFENKFPIIEPTDNVNQYGENKDGKHIK